jgi:hypothetical protein
MRTDAVGNGIDPRLAPQINRKAARFSERGPVELEPAWAAAARQAAVGDGDVGIRAGLGERHAVDLRCRPRRKQPPLPFPFPHKRHASVLGAGAERP